MEFLLLFPFLWVFFALLDTDPDSATQINAYPDPKTCFKENIFCPVMANKNKILILNNLEKWISAYLEYCDRNFSRLATSAES